MRQAISSLVLGVAIAAGTVGLAVLLTLLTDAAFGPWSGVGAALLLAETLLMLIAARERPGFRRTDIWVTAHTEYDLHQDRLRAQREGPVRLEPRWLYAAVPVLITGVALLISALG